MREPALRYVEPAVATTVANTRAIGSGGACSNNSSRLVSSRTSVRMHRIVANCLSPREAGQDPTRRSLITYGYATDRFQRASEPAFAGGATGLCVHQQLCGAARAFLLAAGSGAGRQSEIDPLPVSYTHLTLAPTRGVSSL